MDELSSLRREFRIPDKEIVSHWKSDDYEYVMVEAGNLYERKKGHKNWREVCGGQ